MNTSETLLPCPFCGGEPTYVTNPAQDNGFHAIRCEVCAYQTRYVINPRKIWQTRAVPPSPVVDVEKEITSILTAVYPDMREAVRKDLERIFATFRLATIPDGWQPIATAPKDGTPILLSIAGSDYYSRSGWWSDRFDSWVCRETETEATSLINVITHWQRLPAPKPTGDV